MEFILGLYRDNGTENGNCYIVSVINLRGWVGGC